MLLAFSIMLLKSPLDNWFVLRSSVLIIGDDGSAVVGGGVAVDNDVVVILV